MNKKITLLHLYPNEMNIYGDRGNILTILRRLEWHGYEPELVYHHPDRRFPGDIDIIIGGGGQDSGQNKVQNDLLHINEELRKLADDGVPMLMICGLYQLFGRFFKTSDGETIRGINIFDAETHGGPKRLIGNVVIETPFGEVIGYENHSGQTYLDKSQKPFGSIKKGSGNNGRDRTEGAIYKNVIGSYLHGSLLPKNPDLADSLIQKAAERKFGDFDGTVIDDNFARLAREVAKNRPR